MEELKFEELELCPEILKAVKHMGFEEASPIQSKAIPVIMSGKDVIGQAQTGTGKTAAFGIPLLPEYGHTLPLRFFLHFLRSEQTPVLLRLTPLHILVSF